MKVGVIVLISSLAVAASLAQTEKGNPDRGRYLAENVAMCIQCHSPREADGTLLRTKLYDGAAIPVGKPNQLRQWADFAPRIAGLPQYTEQQMITLLTTGIGREGKALRAPMPTFKMTRQDAADVAAFLKALRQ